MDRDELTKRLQEIAAIADTLPEQYRAKAFELLASTTLGSDNATTVVEPATRSEPATKEPLKTSLPFVMPAKVRVFLQRHGITEDQLRTIVLVEGGEVFFIKEPQAAKIAAAQIQWALLTGLRSALLGGEMQVDPEDVRSLCIAKGYYDRGNFAGNFKTNAAYFQKVPQPQGEPVRLSPRGEQKLAELIRDLLASK